MATNLQNLTFDLRSSKATERTNALEGLRETLKRDKFVHSLDSNDWLVLFNALFDAFGTERTASLKSGNLPTGATGVGAAAVRRLRLVAETIRWMTERSVRRINRKVVAALITHFLHQVKLRGGLFEPVALSYVKALHCLVSSVPHLEHLDRATWIKLVELSCHVVLGESLNRHFDPGANDWEDEVLVGHAGSGSDLDDQFDQEQDEGPSTPRKRPRLRATRTPGPARRENTPRVQEVHVVSHEEREFMALLAILLRDPYAPILSEDNPYLPSAILHRLRLILFRYPGESSLYHDYLLAVSAILAQLSLNHQMLVHKFAVSTWDKLIGMWGSKTSRSKEDLVVVLRALFPYLTLENGLVEASPRPEYYDDLYHLWRSLGSDAERRGAEGLSLDSIRLCVQPLDDVDQLPAFIAITFQPSWHFDVGQALVWATLELQADCAEKLYILSESVHATGEIERNGKRSKIENPITSLLSSIQTQTLCNVRAYHLQSLLFFVVRHWAILHIALRQDVVNTLLQFLSFDDALVQSWTFVCFAAIAHAEAAQVNKSSSSSALQLSLTDHSTWDTIWTHAMRRSTVPAVSRAACHTAHVLLLHSKVLLSPQRVLGELEALAKDLDVQGPSFPCDAVCSFLVLCMQVASRDVRLYRMQLEEKVLSWFSEAWRPGGLSRSRMSPHSVEDILSLLACICGVPKSALLLHSIVLPDSPIVHAVVEERQLIVIRNFLLYARLPLYQPLAGAGLPKSQILAPSDSVQSQILIEDRDLVQPRGRERRISVFLLKALEDALQEWEPSREPVNRATAEKARNSLDLAIITIFFEATLLTNGTSTNRRVLQAACKILRTVAPTITDRRWTADERLMIAMAFEPLIMGEDAQSHIPPWETLLPPGPGTGIRSDLLGPVKRGSQQVSETQVSARRFLQRAALRNSDVQDAISDVLEVLRELLRVTLGQPSNHQDSHAMDIDEGDGFGVSTTASNTQGTSSYGTHTSASATVEATVDICISALSVLPVLQSSSGESTRDKHLIELVLECDGEDLLVLGPAFLRNVQQRTLNLSPSSLSTLLEQLGDFLGEYHWSRSEGMTAFIIHLLHATMHIWLPQQVAEGDIGDRVRALGHWIIEVLDRQEGGARSWSCRDSLVRFFDQYLEQDPSEEVWTDFGRSDLEQTPGSLLPLFAKDEDTRVRLRAAVANARTLSPAALLGSEPAERYVRVKQALCVDTNDYEAIATRLLCLGNIVIVSSAVRRGAYWNLLEACLHSPLYTTHIENVLRGAASRMGLTEFSHLFQAYASQIAFSIRQDNQDILRIPPHLLGYRDRKECAEWAFRAFSPTNIMANGTPEQVQHGRRLFLSHCGAVQKSPSEGIQDCFADIVGIQIVWWIGDYGTTDDDLGEELERLLRERVEEVGSGEQYDALLRQHADGIIAAILSTLSDQDFTLQGPIVASLKEMQGSVFVEAFCAMSCYRKIDDFILHQPNLPAFNTTAVLKALQWFRTKVPSADQPATTYHVLHELFARIDRSPLVNEQFRLLNGICLWISQVQDDCRDVAVLRTLINGATALLSRSDLARAAQSLLEWAFGICGEVFVQKDSRFAETLIRVGCAAHDFSCSDEEHIATMGQDILQWAEGQASKLLKYKALKSPIHKALSAWPRELPPILKAVSDGTTSRELSEVLEDQAISSNKFRLVRRLRDLARNHLYDDIQFAQSDFWRLKECIPSSSQLSSDDLDAFCELLVLQKGGVNGLGGDQASLPSVRKDHIHGIRKKTKEKRPKSGSFLAPQQAIVSTLLATLRDQSLQNAYLAYDTLRSLVVSPQLDPESSAWPSSARGELSLLQTYPRPTRSRPPRDFHQTINDPVYEEMASDFRRWVTNIASLLIDILAPNVPFYAPLSLMTNSDYKFSDNVLPVLVQTILQTERSTNPNEMPIRDQLSSYLSRVLSSESTAVATRRSIVDVVLHLRHFTPSDSRDTLAYDKWLNVDYILLSKSAISCGAYTTALLFLELAAEYSRDAGEGASTVEDILFNIYSHIDEPDGFYGIKTADLRGFLIKRFHHERQWDKAFQFHGAGVETRSNDPVDTEGVLLALHSYGFDHLAMSTLHGFPGSQQEHHMSYQLGWRTDIWDLPERPNSDDPGAPLYLALRAVNRERDPGVVQKVIHRVLVDVVDQFRVLGNENVTEIRQLSQSLMCLSQVRQWQSEWPQQALQSRVIDAARWGGLAVIDEEFNFEDLETLMATRISLLRSARQKAQREQIGDMVSPFAQSLIDAEVSCLLRLSRAAREADQPQVALNSVTRAQRLSSQPKVEVAQEFANVLWLTKEPKIAVQYLRSLVPSIGSKSDGDMEGKIRKALLLSRLGTWTSQACLERPANISNEYFAPAAQLADEISATSGTFPSRKATIFHNYATFAERQYHALVKSPDALRWKLYMDRKAQEIRERQQQLSAPSSKTPVDTNAMAKAKHEAERVLEKDRKKFEELTKTRYAFLELAIDMHSRSLEASDEFDDDAPIRLCSLWFANFDYKRGGFQQKVGQALERVASRKFVFLAHQLAARLSKSEGASQAPSAQNLLTLMTRMCREHPFHSLYQVFCLKADHTVSRSAQPLGRRQSKRFDSPSQTDRAVAAQDIFDKLRSDTQCGERARNVESLCIASLSWAKHPVKSWASARDKAFTIPPGMEILKIKDLPIPVVTAHTPLDPTTRYDRCAWISHFDTTFKTAGGLNVPKISYCYGSDGAKYKQLYKGEGADDLRQDAVMEQVFDLVNVVLKHDRETRKRDLSIRGYKVIPLASQAGIIEFVTNTTPLGDWLLPAHRKYRPQDIPHGKVGEIMKDKRAKCVNGDFSSLASSLIELQQQFRPVMRHYFTESHKTPMSWFRMRLRYSRSVATTSIVGHILGLGDRHTSNILLHNGSGEVVHIDLGIAFEQGTLLPIPERVPFRLTADMVDGLGTSGTQGVFQRCAEETLRVLRDGSEVILTVLEVFKYDPLHSWTASELKVRRAQDSKDTGEVTEEALRIIGIEAASGTAEAADRALSAVSRKLDKTLTVEFTVNELIAEATDAGNLACMWMGWAPYS